MAARTQPILSLERLRQRRLEAGLSERALARATAMTGMSITALEEGRNHDELSLRHLVRIARALNVEPEALFSPDAAKTDPAPDDVGLEAALASIGSYTRVETLARGLGWTLDRTAAALEQLRRRLEQTGQRIATQHGKVKLAAVADALSARQGREVAQASTHERGVTLQTAQLLRLAVDERVDARWQRAANAGHLLAQASLLKLGWAEFRDNRLEPSADVLYGLEATEEDTEAPPHVPPRRRRAIGKSDTSLSR